MFYVVLIYYKLILLAMNITKRENRFYPLFLNFALKLCPDFYDRLDKPKKIICVMGTNGKTSLCRLLRDSLNSLGYKAIDNCGWNLLNGVTHMMARTVSITNHNKYDYAVIEVDELSSKITYKKVKPDIIVFTNLSRDSLKDNANSMYMLEVLKKSLPNTKLVLNADDIIISDLKNNKTKFYGIDSLNSDKDYNDNIVNDIPLCPICSSKLNYKKHRYNHIGKCYCESCKFQNNKTDYTLSNLNRYTMVVNDYEYPIISNSIFNIYNELATIATLQELRIKDIDIKLALQDIRITDDRFCVKYINDYKFTSILSKGQNPVACSSVFRYVNQDKNIKDIFIMLDDIDDNNHNSETVSWLFETDFEFLKDNLHHITVAGKRRYDMLVRLLLAGIPKNKVTLIEKEEDLVNYIDKDIKTLYFLYDITRLDSAIKMRREIEMRLK